MWTQLRSHIAVAVISAAALIQPLASELPYAAGVAIKRRKEKKKKKKKIEKRIMRASLQHGVYVPREQKQKLPGHLRTGSGTKTCSQSLASHETNLDSRGGKSLHTSMRTWKEI